MAIEVAGVATSKREVVVSSGPERGGHAGAIDLDRVLELSDSGEEEVCVADRAEKRGRALFVDGEQLGVLCEEELDGEEGSRVEEREGVRERQSDVDVVGHGASTKLSLAGGRLRFLGLAEDVEEELFIEMR